MSFSRAESRLSTRSPSNFGTTGCRRVSYDGGDERDDLPGRADRSGEYQPETGEQHADTDRDPGRVREEKHEQNRIDMDALSQMVDDYETQLKFVVTDASDLPQITDLVDRVREATATTVADDDVLLMPEGMTREQLDGTRSEVAELAMEYGYRYTPRLHVDLWNDAPGT